MKKFPYLTYFHWQRAVCRKASNIPRWNSWVVQSKLTINVPIWIFFSWQLFSYFTRWLKLETLNDEIKYFLTFENICKFQVSLSYWFYKFQSKFLIMPTRKPCLVGLVAAFLFCELFHSPTKNTEQFLNFNNKSESHEKNVITIFPIITNILSY